jgi:tetraacyldisaccharide-1-P 4'-kinase
MLTTEKDYIKIRSFKNDDIKHLKIELDIKNEDKLIDYLKTYI